MCISPVRVFEKLNKFHVSIQFQNFANITNLPVLQKSHMLETLSEKIYSFCRRTKPDYLFLTLNRFQPGTSARRLSRHICSSSSLGFVKEDKVQNYDFAVSFLWRFPFWSISNTFPNALISERVPGRKRTLLCTWKLIGGSAPWIYQVVYKLWKARQQNATSLSIPPFYHIRVIRAYG